MFNVRSVDFARRLLTINSQTELALSTHVTVSNIHYEAVNTRTLVSDVHHNVLNTHAIVSDIHRNILGGQEGADSQRRSVGLTRTLSPNRHLPLDRCKIGQRFQLLLGLAPDTCI